MSVQNSVQNTGNVGKCEANRVSTSNLKVYWKSLQSAFPAADKVLHGPLSVTLGIWMNLE